MIDKLIFSEEIDSQSKVKKCAIYFNSVDHMLVEFFAVDVIITCIGFFLNLGGVAFMCCRLEGNLFFFSLTRQLITRLKAQLNGFDDKVGYIKFLREIFF